MSEVERTAEETDDKCGHLVDSNCLCRIDKSLDTDSASVFSEDSAVHSTSDMGEFLADRTDDLDIQLSPPPELDGPGCEGRGARSEEADSTYNSDGSSVSTLESCGDIGIDDLKADGSDCENHEGDSCNSPRKRPAIKLLLEGPTDDMNGADSASPGDSLEDNEDEGAKSSASGFYEDREFDFLKTEPVRRSTSLKTYKTPPGTPSRKKAVRFADVLGLDLESVRHILNLEEPPTVPLSAMKDLKVGLEEDHKTEGVRFLTACFSQPGAAPDFLDRVKGLKVSLENCIVDDKDMTVTGTIRVANVCFHKKLIVRFTLNNWLTFEDVTASYVQNSNDGPTDSFCFTITVPQYFSVGSRLEFAVMFNGDGTVYWDSNFGKNYSVECYARSIPLSENDNAWVHFL